MSVRHTRKKRTLEEKVSKKKKEEEENEGSEREETVDSVDQTAEEDGSQPEDDASRKPPRKGVAKRRQVQQRPAKLGKPHSAKNKDKADKAKDSDREDDIVASEETTESPSESAPVGDNESEFKESNGRIVVEPSAVPPPEPLLDKNATAITLLEHLKTEIAELKTKVAAQDAVIQHHLDKEDALQTDFELLLEELKDLKKQQQSLPLQTATKGWEKALEELEFVKDEIQEVHMEVREWRWRRKTDSFLFPHKQPALVAMDIDLTDKEERVSSVASRLDDVERNQQALLIRHPQLFGVPLPQPQQPSLQNQPSKQSAAQKLTTNKHERPSASQVRPITHIVPSAGSGSQSTTTPVSSVGLVSPLSSALSSNSSISSKPDISTRLANSSPNVSTYPLSNSTIKNASILPSRPFKPPPVVTAAQYKYTPQSSAGVGSLATENPIKPTEKKKRKRESGKAKVTTSPVPLTPIQPLLSTTKSPMSIGISAGVGSIINTSTSSLHSQSSTPLQTLSQQPENATFTASSQVSLTPPPPQDFNEPLCTVCGEIGKILMCDGPCLRSWHLACIGLTEVPDEEPWLCADCKDKSWACFLCKKHHANGDGDSIKKCVLKQCGKHYHPSCVDAFSSSSSKSSEEDCNPFLCPRHFCYACGGGPPQPGSTASQQQIVHCFKCPRSYHKKCMPIECQKTKESKFIICPLHVKEPGSIIESSQCDSGAANHLPLSMSPKEPINEEPANLKSSLETFTTEPAPSKPIAVEDLLDISELDNKY